jgi:putative ABC transport system permease protein
LPVTYLTSFHHQQINNTPEKTASLASLKPALQEIAPSLLWFDVQSLIAQLRQLMQQAGTAVSFLYVFALLASVLVIFSATLAAQEGRYRQWLVLRTLGAQTGQLVLIGLFEYVLIGLLAGTLSAFLAQATQMLIALYWLNLSPQWDMKLWFIGWGIGVASLVILAYLAQAPLRKLGAKQLQSRAS